MAAARSLYNCNDASALVLRAGPHAFQLYRRTVPKKRAV